MAAKSRPSNLSIEVWRLMESVRKNDCEITDRSDDSSQDNENPTSRMSIQAILDKLTLPTETGWDILTTAVSFSFSFSKISPSPTLKNRAKL